MRAGDEGGKEKAYHAERKESDDEDGEGAFH